MQYNDTTTRTGLIQDCEYLTALGDASISGDTELLQVFTRSLNSWYHKVVTMILASQDEWDFDDSAHGDFPLLTTPLTTNRDYEIPLSEKVLKIKRLDVSWDGVTAKKVEPLDVNEIGAGVMEGVNDAELDAKFSIENPFYDTGYNRILLYPKATQAQVDAGGKLQITWTREIDEFTTADTTQEPAIDEPFHRMLSIGASFDYAQTYQLPMANNLFALVQDYEARLKEYYGTKQQDRKIVLKPAFVDYD